MASKMHKSLLFLFIMALALGLALTGCGNRAVQSEANNSEPLQSALQTSTSSDNVAEDSALDSTEDLLPQPSGSPESDPSDEETIGEMKLMIGDTKVSVQWEDNESVEALKELVTEAPVTIQMSMYGGFEQVGSLETSLPRNDVQTTTQAGDIVLYSGSNLVIFYGSNSWAYTRLGRITDKSASEIAALLGSGNVTIVISED